MDNSTQTTLEHNLMSEILDYVAKDIIQTGVEHGEGIISMPELYPSGKPVLIKIRPHGENFFVTDNGFGYSEADYLGGGKIYNKIARQVAEYHGVDYDGIMMFVTEVSKEYLPNAIIFTAAASRRCVEITAEKIAASKNDNRKLIMRDLLRQTFRDKASFDVEYSGHSTKRWKFDAIVNKDDRDILFDLVVPNHVSINDTIVKFHDIKKLDDQPRRIALLSDRTKMDLADISLISDAADVVAPLDTNADYLLKAA